MKGKWFLRNRKRFYYSNDNNKAERDVLKPILGPLDPRMAVKVKLHNDGKKLFG